MSNEIIFYILFLIQWQEQEVQAVQEVAQEVVENLLQLRVAAEGQYQYQEIQMVLIPSHLDEKV